eukprot:TRINITY_DN16726_c0_g1_i1.p1 TRINITY_DN16726_c0_g1~~TRINITY_DN16726_c0_g1_i1.p1  ORF type:complete len:265 (-),score=53.24 TRINITY_DN16726_c0_g1_i1:189-983(-)
MTPYGKLIVYYCSLLTLSHRYNEVKQIILDYINAPAISADVLAQANLYKLLGFANDKAQSSSLKYYRLAKQLFFKSNSYLGQAACLIALGETELRKEEYNKAKWSYENALRHYCILRHSCGAAWCNSVLAFIKERIELLNESREYAVQARLGSDSQLSAGVKYIGGVFVRRWEASADNFIVEVARVTNGKRITSLVEFMADTRMKHSNDVITDELGEEVRGKEGLVEGKKEKEAKREAREESTKLSFSVLSAIPLKIKKKQRNA